MIMLTDDERRKFALWLRQEIVSDEALLRQMEKLSIPQLASRKRAEILAKAMVANQLETTESVTING